jgi:hypothetical protein
MFGSLSLLPLGCDPRRRLNAGDLAVRRSSGLGDPGAYDRAVVLPRGDIEVDVGDPCVVEGIAQEIEHPLPRGPVLIIAKLETESVSGAPDELHHHLDVYAIGWRPVCRAPVVDAEKTDLTTRIDGHGSAPS